MATGSDNADLFMELPSTIDKWKKKGAVMFNVNKEPLPNDKEAFKNAIVTIELTRNVLEHLY